ncbi:MAG TPA: carbamoyltransferase HypF [Bacteroidales bacterium]|nr:carbamoyltransferase HypF [Bacteroidales bacterium]
MNTYLIEIKGLVQGVGFRPFIYRIAAGFHLNGQVENRNDGVFIVVNCDEKTVKSFIQAIWEQAPQAAAIESVDFRITDTKFFDDFQIVKSRTVSNRITDISPDIAVCEDCLRDMKTQKNRIDYPFINCTNCGPRFTIIQNIPYDRAKTTMSPFVMCDDCKKEYLDVIDRRFHAQPVACSVCGPEYTLFEGKKELKGIENIVSRVQYLLQNKKIVAIKGIGGFFIACNAVCEETVARLRKMKNREGKPFAVMFSGMETLKEYAFVNAQEEKSLVSYRRPIVLLYQKKSLAPSVNVGFDTIGCMLPYMPIHYLLFRGLTIPAIVLTSGNISDEPIITDNEIAIEKLSDITDAILTYNRAIYNRTDDSVVTIVNKHERLIRRSRGYVPTPLKLTTDVDGILATGAELVNCFAVGRENKAIISQHIGDLKNFETYEFYCESIERFKRLFIFEPRLVVSDLHPDYLSTRFAYETKLPHVKVQHHHAHIASCMAEHNLDEKVIGVSFDGTGLGDDNNIWGSEFFICDLAGYARVNHFDYMPMPGGDKVTEEPWRMAVSYLYKYFGQNFYEFNLPFLNSISTSSVEMLCQAIDKKINSPLSSGCGRLFDAVAALTNLCPVSRFHAEAPMRLEAVMDKNNKESYHFSIHPAISFCETFRQIIADINKGIPVSTISAKFHNTILSVIMAVANDTRSTTGITKVVLSGGTFQNKYLLGSIEHELTRQGYEVFTHKKVPTNDAGIALGQMAIAAKRRTME